MCSGYVCGEFVSSVKALVTKTFRITTFNHADQSTKVVLVIERRVGTTLALIESLRVPDTCLMRDHDDEAGLARSREREHAYFTWTSFLIDKSRIRLAKRGEFVPGSSQKLWGMMSAMVADSVAGKPWFAFPDNSTFRALTLGLWWSMKCKNVRRRVRGG